MQADPFSRTPAHILQELADVLADPEEWLDSNNELFGGQAPRAFIGTQNEHLISEVAQRLKHGFVS